MASSSETSRKPRQILRGSGSFLAMPSPLNGLARLLDIGGTFRPYRRQRPARVSDAEALAGDWARVGSDLSNAMGTWSEHQDALKSS